MAFQKTREKLARLLNQRTYQLIRQRGAITERTFTITFPDPGAQAYCFTFG